MGKVEGAVPPEHSVSLEDYRSEGDNRINKVFIAAGGPGHRDAGRVQRLADSCNGDPLHFPQVAQLSYPDPSFLIIRY